jgi:hypothetical protein
VGLENSDGLGDLLRLCANAYGSRGRPTEVLEAICRWPSVGVRTLDRPNGVDSSEGSGRRQDRQSVHEPDRGIAAGVAPENVALAVAVEVTGFPDRPIGGHCAEQPGRRQDRQAVHEPDRGIAAGVAPENVGLAVAIEVAGSHDRPGGGYQSERPG